MNLICLMGCYPIEILLIIFVLLITLSTIYKLSASIFVFSQKSKKQKAKDNGYIEFQAHRMNDPYYIQEQSSMLNTMSSPNN